VRDPRRTRVSRNAPRTGAYGAAGVLGATGAVIALAFGGPVWSVVWIALAVVIGAAVQIGRTRRNAR